MLSTEENELLTRVGPGTPMGELLRRFWLPALLSDEVPTPDCDPVRTRHLGEDLVAYRDTNGKVGVVDAFCPHRRAPLFFGRNEECGLRCVYHGWKFDVDGNCVDVPSEPPESHFKDRIKLKSYPTYETGGVVWLYMGPAEHQPERPPDLPFTLVPEEQQSGIKFLVESSFFQNLEGELDTAHVSFLHSSLDDSADLSSLVRLDGYNNDRHPRLSLIDTDYGFVYGGRRTRSDGEYYWRVTQFLLPIYALIPRSGGYTGGATIWVPIDDHHCWRFLVGGRGPSGGTSLAARGPLPIRRGMYTFDDGRVIDTYLTENNKANLYGMDRQKQRTTNFTGMGAIPTEDQAMNEGMGYIVDRSQEHLATTDVAIVAMRRRMLNMIRDLQNGIEPNTPHRPEAYRVRPLDVDSSCGELTELLEQHADDVRMPGDSAAMAQ
jgi:phthalate 4,5-dioxygenase